MALSWLQKNTLVGYSISVGDQDELELFALLEKVSNESEPSLRVLPMNNIWMEPFPWSHDASLDQLMENVTPVVNESASRVLGYYGKCELTDQKPYNCFVGSVGYEHLDDDHFLIVCTLFTTRECKGKIRFPLKGATRIRFWFYIDDKPGGEVEWKPIHPTDERIHRVLDRLTAEAVFSAII